MAKKTTKRAKSAQFIKEHESIFICPICSSKMSVNNLNSMVCKNQHSFDLAKQGYINLLIQHSKTNYDKVLFEARKKIIADSGLFDRFNEILTEALFKEMIENKDLIIDMGTGEGTHLARIIQSLESTFNTKVSGIGIDISKEGITEAAKNYEDIIWIVADLARTPLANKASDVIINILSPSNYNEFKRILKNDGFIIKVVPRENYLKELRQHFYHQSDKEVYANTNVVEHFKENFQLIKKQTINYTKTLTPLELKLLIKMTPLTWNVEEEEINTFINKGLFNITIDLELLIGKKKNIQNNV